MSTRVNADELATKVKELYRHVAEKPHASYHFELGRQLAVRLGYAVDILDRIPAGAVESFAGVGYFFDLAGLGEGDAVIDLGSGSGMDAFYAAQLVGPSGRVVGIDFTVQQLDKARRLAADVGLHCVEFREGRIESPPADDESADCVISNGVINLSPDKEKVSRRPRAWCGRAAGLRSPTSSPNANSPMPSSPMLTCGRPASAGRRKKTPTATRSRPLAFASPEIRRNAYEFISAQARNATGTYGVKSISLLAARQRRDRRHGIDVAVDRRRRRHHLQLLT